MYGIPRHVLWFIHGHRFLGPASRRWQLKRCTMGATGSPPALDDMPLERHCRCWSKMGDEYGMNWWTVFWWERNIHENRRVNTSKIVKNKNRLCGVQYTQPSQGKKWDLGLPDFQTNPNVGLAVGRRVDACFSLGRDEARSKQVPSDLLLWKSCQLPK